MLKKGYELYYNRQSYRQVNSEVAEEIIALKDQMNKKRTEFKHPSEAGHRIIITPYWLLGFVEAEGYFLYLLKSIDSQQKLRDSLKIWDYLLKIRDLCLAGLNLI